MPSGKSLATVFIAVTIAAVLFIPIANVVSDNTGNVDVTNESVTAVHDQYVDLDGYDLEDGSETVLWLNSSSGSYESVSSGTDYEIDYGAGQIQALSTGTIGDGDELLVSYTYAATDSTTTAIVILVPLFVGLLILVVLAREITARV